MRLSNPLGALIDNPLLSAPFTQDYNFPEFIPISPGNFMLTEDGNLMITESGEYMITE
jgi:hypothetical protein